MSTPYNVLSKFRTYSYHHILVICDTVETATSISIADNSTGTSRLNDVVKRSVDGLYSSERLETDPTTKGNYVVMINGMTDAHYAIDELKWESITGQRGNNNSGNYTAMVTEGGMVINEPKGVRFLNDIKQTYEALNRDHNSCVWMIKTIFVGYNDHHQEKANQPEYFTNIAPLIFTVVELEAEFNVQGAIYDIKFVNINNGVSKMPQINDITSTVKMNLTKDALLKSAIGKLFEKINFRYNKYYSSVVQDLKAQGIDPLAIEYEYELSDEYRLDTGYTVDDVQQQTTSDGLTTSGAAMDFSKGITIENAIKTIMNKCEKIKDDAAGETKTKDKYGFKIRTILKSNKDKYIIKYYIERQKLMFSNIFDASKSNDPELQAQLDENTLSLDYIYTGQNIDIIDYSMKMEMGFVFFQQLTNGNNLRAQSEHPTDVVSQVANDKPINVNDPDNSDGSKKNIPKKLPIFYRKNNKNPETANTKSPKKAAEFQSLLDRHAALENLQSKVKIHGNPALLNSINKVPKGFGKNESTKVEENSVFPHWEKVPALIEINIMMPIEENGVVVKMEPFWYTGKYYVFSVANEFSGGLFTQELEMISMPNSIEEGTTSNAKEKKPFTTEQVHTIVTNEDGSKTTLINGEKHFTVKPWVAKPVVSDGETAQARLDTLRA